MEKKKRIIILSVNLALSVAVILLTVFLMDDWGVLVRTAYYCVAGGCAVVSIVTFIIDKQAILKSALIIAVLASVFLTVFILMGKFGGLNQYETDEEKVDALVKMIENTGAWGMLVFFIIQILQIVVLPLPAAVCYIPGARIWGPLVGTLLASAGVLVGSVINYFIGKLWGKKAVVWIAGEETTEKYSAYFGKKGKGNPAVFPRRYLMYGRGSHRNELSFLFGNYDFGPSARNSGVLLRLAYPRRPAVGNSGMGYDFRSMYSSRRTVLQVSGKVRKLAG